MPLSNGIIISNKGETNGIQMSRVQQENPQTVGENSLNTFINYKKDRKFMK